MSSRLLVQLFRESLHSEQTGTVAAEFLFLYSPQFLNLKVDQWASLHNGHATPNVAIKKDFCCKLPHLFSVDRDLCETNYTSNQQLKYIKTDGCSTRIMQVSHARYTTTIEDIYPTIPTVVLYLVILTLQELSTNKLL